MYVKIDSIDNDQMMTVIETGRGHSVCLFIWFCLNQRAHENKSCNVFVSLKRLSLDTGLSRVTVIKCINALESIKFIKKNKEKAHATTGKYYCLKNEYQLLRGAYSKCELKERA